MPKTSILTVSNRDEVAEAYRNGARVRSLAKQYKCRSTEISAILAAHGLLPAGRRGHPKFSPAQQTQLADKYRDGQTLRQLAAEFGTSTMSVRSALMRQGVEAREQKRPPFWTPARINQMIELRAAGLSEQAIGEVLGVSQSAINRRLMAVGVEPRKSRPSGESHGSWKGGRSIDGSGYVLVKVLSQDDLRFVRPNVSGYALEHRLVVGRSIGRWLLPTETVHHINGVKTDNRLENLQLRQGKHGKGVVMKCCDCGSTNVQAMELT